MIIRDGRLKGVKIVQLEPLSDKRGFFARTFCETIFKDHGLNTKWVQCNLTETTKKGAVRGMHWQDPPHGEIKLIRCEAGAVWDCLVDIRKGSPTYGQWEAIELNSHNGWSVYVPEGIAHGFQTLESGSRLFYMMSTAYCSEAAKGIRWNDSDVGISWPLEVSQVGERDLAWPDLTDIDLIF